MTDQGSQERRNTGTRVPFEALIELDAHKVGAFEAESVDLSSDGMRLRTAYCPKIGTPLRLRFESCGGPANGRPTQTVFADGIVVWAHDGTEGPEFGVRFLPSDRTDGQALAKIVAVAIPSERRRVQVTPLPAQEIPATECIPLQHASPSVLSRVAHTQCHVEPYDLSTVDQTNEASPATSRGAHPDHLPDTQINFRNEAHTSEESKMDPVKETSNETLRTSNGGSPIMPRTGESQPIEDARSPEKKDASKDSIVATVWAITLLAWAAIAHAASSLWTRLSLFVSTLMRNSSANATRKTTTAVAAPVPATKRLRPQISTSSLVEAPDGGSLKGLARRPLVMGAIAVSAIALLVFVATRHSHSSPAPDAAASTIASAFNLAAPLASLSLPEPPIVASSASGKSADLVGDSTGVDSAGNPNPFGQSTVRHGTKLLLRLDGPVSEIRGLTTPDGFVISIPNRKSLESAGILATKDPRVATAKVENLTAGIELTVNFKNPKKSKGADEVVTIPDYVARAKGNAIEVVISKESTTAHHKKHATKKASAKGDDDSDAKSDAKSDPKGDTKKAPAHHTHNKK